MPRPIPIAALLALLAALAACAAPAPAPAPELPPPPYPAETRTRMLRLVLGEWQEWGGRVLDARTAPTSDADEGPVAEQHPAAFSKVLAYWSAVGWKAEIARNRRAFTLGLPTECTPGELSSGGRAALWGCQPWSAAFLSFVLRATGVDAVDFPSSAAHWEYVDALLRTSDRWGPRAPFLAHDAADHPPAPGDIVCADRSRTPLPSLAARRAESGRPRPMHCDIVIATAAGEVTAVGGNVAQAVTAVRHATDGQGRLSRVLRPWFVVFENRMGRQADPAP